MTRGRSWRREILRLVVPGLAALGGTAHSLPAAEMNIVTHVGKADLLREFVEAYTTDRDGLAIAIANEGKGLTRETALAVRLERGEAGDVFLYHSGALFDAVDAGNLFVDLNVLPALARIDPDFRGVVSENGHVYGVPFGEASFGGILFNKQVYAELGLKPPQSWAEFMANNRRIAAAGLVPVMQTYATPWTAQLIPLADFYNVYRQAPGFAAGLTAGVARFADTPAALRSFEKAEELAGAGFLNADRQTLGLEDGLKALVSGRAAHYPMLGFALADLERDYPGSERQIGFFPVPPDQPGAMGLTIWLPPALYLPKTAKQPLDALNFLNFIAGPQGCAVLRRLGHGALSLIEGCGSHEELPWALRPYAAMLDDPSLHTPALEFLTPLKGPSFEQITTALGLGIINAREAALRYDRDIATRARELGLDGWN